MTSAFHLLERIPQRRLHTTKCSSTSTKLAATLGAGGFNASPASMCEIENVPLLDPVPDG